MLISGFVLLFAFFSIGGYLLGVEDAIRLYSDNNDLTSKTMQLTKDRDDTQRQLLMQKQISKVDKAANFHAANSMDLQLQQIHELERELKFFRSIMAPEETIKGLQISRFNWQQLDNSVLNWQLSLIQAGYQGRTLSGVVKASIVAMRGNEKVFLPLINEDKNERFKYRFRYFQHITGTISIAEGLIPIAVNIIAIPSVKGQSTQEKQFPWQSDEEKFADVE